MRSYQFGFAFLKFFLVTLLFSGLLAGFLCIKIKGHQIFPISQIKIASNYQQVSKIHLKTTLANYIEKKNFLTLNISQLKKKLLTIPWIQDVKIQRVWPGTLLIKLEEQKPIALLNEKGIVNQKGELFYPRQQSIPSNLPHLIAPLSEINTVLQHYQQMVIMSKPLNVQIVLLELKPDQSCKVVLNNGSVLLLGKTHIIPRWRRFIAAYPKLLEESLTTQQRMGQIDLRYPHGFAVRWRPNVVHHPN